MLNLIHNMNRDSCRTVDGIASETYVLHSLNAKAAPTVTVTVAPNNVVSRSLGCRFFFLYQIHPCGVGCVLGLVRSFARSNKSLQSIVLIMGNNRQSRPNS